MPRIPSPEVPDTILPVQFFDRTAATDSPEKRLMFAVLLDAIMQLRRGDSVDAVEAERWVRDEGEGVPVTFSQACEVLGFESQHLARGLLSWRAHAGDLPAAGGRELPGMQRRVTPLARMRRRGVRSLGELSPAQGHVGPRA